MNISRKAAKSQAVKLKFRGGYQWGEPLDGESSLLINRVGNELEITAAMPSYLAGDHPCDLIRQYEIGHKNRSIAKQRTGRDSPQIRFANANSDDELIDFVRSFGPVVAKHWGYLPQKQRLESSINNGAPPCENPVRATQGLDELRSEQRIYSAALGLVLELAKRDSNYDTDSAKQWIAEIARGIRDWPRQWNREKKIRGKDPLWRVRKDSIERIAHFAESGPDAALPPQVDARIVISQLVNVFPLFAFPNLPEMHSYIRFGIRPLLYNVLRREYLQSRDIGVCANTQCRAFFEVERARQRFCNELCSRRQRQREYWEAHGKETRHKRLGAQPKPQNAKRTRATSVSRAV